MKRYTIAVLVRNEFGVLNRVTSMFRRRQFNITSLTVSETESSKFSRITVTFDDESGKKDQLINQLYKLPDVVSIRELNSENCVSLELLLIKMANEAATRGDIRTAADAFGAEIMDYSKESMMFRLTAESRKIDDFIKLMMDFSIIEICRTGIVSLEKGSDTLRVVTNL